MSRRSICGVLAACVILSQLSGCGAKTADSTAPAPSFGTAASAVYGLVLWLLG